MDTLIEPYLTGNVATRWLHVKPGGCGSNCLHREIDAWQLPIIAFGMDRTAVGWSGSLLWPSIRWICHCTRILPASQFLYSLMFRRSSWMVIFNIGICTGSIQFLLKLNSTSKHLYAKLQAWAGVSYNDYIWFYFPAAYTKVCSNCAALQRDGAWWWTVRGSKRWNDGRNSFLDLPWHSRRCSTCTNDSGATWLLTQRIECAHCCQSDGRECQHFESSSENSMLG